MLLHTTVLGCSLSSSSVFANVHSVSEVWWTINRRLYGQRLHIYWVRWPVLYHVEPFWLTGNLSMPLNFHISYQSNVGEILEINYLQGLLFRHKVVPGHLDSFFFKWSVMFTCLISSHKWDNYRLIYHHKIRWKVSSEMFWLEHWSLHVTI